MSNMLGEGWCSDATTIRGAFPSEPLARADSKLTKLRALKESCAGDDTRPELTTSSPS
jgi:hypothetical protein